MTIEKNTTFCQAIEAVESSHQHLFITGKAGTGKSTLLEYFTQNTQKNLVVLAPTGVAALNVGGQTVHRFFNFYIDVTVEKIQDKVIKPRSKKIYQQIDMIIIDEISMLRADLLDCIDAFLRLYGPKPGVAFGGVKMVFVGDLYQLPPVVSRNEQELFQSIYRSPYFFSAKVFDDMDIQIITLDKIYRQNDTQFVELLNKIRNNILNFQDLATINQRVAQPLPQGAFSMTLTTTNKSADAINEENLEQIKRPLKESQALIQGDFTREYFPTQEMLQYKVGAQIMMLNNDPIDRWVNGSVGVIESIQPDKEGIEAVWVRLESEEHLVKILPYKWQIFKYVLKDNKIDTESAGSFTQYPFRLAWAVTIHKSQGKTFDHVEIDLGNGTFASGQAYVAFSRCTTFEGISLKKPLKKHHVRVDPRIRLALRETV